MDVKHCISFAITYDGISLLCRVIDEPKCFFIRFISGFGMLGRDGPEGNENCRVDGNDIIKQGSKNVLDQVDGFGWGKKVYVILGSILYSGAIVWTIPRVWFVLWAMGDGMLEFMVDLF